MTVIARAYETEHKASEAISALIASGVTEDRIQMVRPDSAQSTASDGLRAGKALSQHSNAESYAIALAKGQTVVIAEAHFGKGLALSSIMDACNPVPLEVTAGSAEDAFDSSTPFSYMLGMRVLLRNNPAPFSTMFGFSTESSGRSSLKRWFGGELGGSATPLTNMLPFPALTTRSSSFFSKFGLRDLSEHESRTSSFGKPLLMDSASPLSDKMGKDCLSDNPAPLSSKLGLKLLSTERDRTPAPPVSQAD